MNKSFIKAIYLHLLFIIIQLNTPCNTQLCESSQTATTSNSDYGSCYCDLTQNFCDINCCCDQDCTAAMVASFSTCITNPNPISPQLCSVSSGLFCINTDNYPDRNYFLNQLPVCNYTTFDSLSQTYASRQSSSATPNPPIPTFAIDGTVFRPDDPVYAYYPSISTTDLIRMPMPLRAAGSSACSDLSPIGYLRDASGECVRSYANLTAACSQNYGIVLPSQVAEANSAPMLNVLSYCGGGSLYLISSPSCVVGQSCTSANGFVPNVTIIVLGPNGAESIGSCSSTYVPSWNSSANTCNNVVTEVAYQFVYQYSSQGYTGASITITLSSVSVNTAAPLIGTSSPVVNVLQRFSARFVHVDVLNNPVTNRFRSGNPGYLLGQPVLAGRLTNFSTLNYIQMSTSKAQQLNLLYPSGASQGECFRCLELSTTGVSSGSGVPNTAASCFRPILFGHQFRTGCTISFTTAQLAANCTSYSTLIQTLLWNQASTGSGVASMIGQVPTHIAAFGNASTDEVGNWVPLLQGNSLSATSFTNGVCQNMITGFNLNILYSKQSSLVNAQPKIIGAQYLWTQENIYIRCVTPYCTNPGALLPQQLEARLAVNWIDASVNATGAQMETPTFALQFPAGFFAPFFQDSISSSASSFHLFTMPLPSSQFWPTSVSFGPTFASTLSVFGSEPRPGPGPSSRYTAPSPSHPRQGARTFDDSASFTFWASALLRHYLELLIRPFLFHLRHSLFYLTGILSILVPLLARALLS